MKSATSELGAIGFAVAGFTFWVLADTSIKLAGQSRLPAYEVIAFMGLFVMGFLVLRGVWRRDLAALRPKHVGRQIVRSLLDLGNNICVVIALRHLSLTLFYVLVFLVPMVVAVLSALFLGETLHWRKILAILAGFAGVIIAVDPFGSARQGDWIGFAACMTCVACFSVNMVWSRVITQIETAESLTLFSGIIMAVAGFGLMLWHAEPLNTRLTIVLSAMGLFCVLGTLCYFYALKHTSAATVSQYHYTQLVSGTLLMYLIWHQVPSLSVIIGGVVIVGSGLYIAMLASREHFRGVPVSRPVPE